MFEGQVIVGFCVSLTVTVNEQPAPDESEQLTVVVPTLKKVPLAGMQVIMPVQAAPVSVGLEKVTMAPHMLLSFDLVMFAGHVSVQSMLVFWKRATNMSESLRPEVLMLPATSILPSD